MHECADKPAGTLGQSTRRDHLTLNESPRITATVGGCAPGLTQLIAAARPGSRTRDSTGHASTAPRLPAGRRRTWRRIPTLPSPIFHTPLDPMHFTEGTEPSPQKSRSGQGVWLRDLGSDLCAPCEKRFSSEKCDCCGLAMAGAPPLRFEKSTPPPDLVARPAAAAPPLASRRLTETSVALAERCCRPLDRCDRARARVRSPRSQRSLRSPRRLYPNPRLAPFSRTTRVPRFDRKTFSRIFKSPDQPDRRMRST